MTSKKEYVNTTAKTKKTENGELHNARKVKKSILHDLQQKEWETQVKEYENKQI